MSDRRLVVAVDFDGTCVDHRYPDIGDDVPGAVECLHKLADGGAKIVLFTMRGNRQLGDGRNTLADAVKWFEDRKIPLHGVNRNPSQDSWTDSPKAYAHVYVDDAALGCPLKENVRSGGRPYVDWEKVRPLLMDML